MGEGSHLLWFHRLVHDWGRLPTGTQGNRGDGVESEPPAGNAATLPCYDIGLFSVRPPICLRKLTTTICFVSKAPLRDGRCSVGSFH